MNTFHSRRLSKALMLPISCDCPYITSYSMQGCCFSGWISNQSPISPCQVPLILHLPHPALTPCMVLRFGRSKHGVSTEDETSAT